MRAGALRHPITIQAATDSIGARGGVAATYSTFAATWAEILPVGGSEQFRSQQTFPEGTHTLRIRYRSGVTPKMRILFGTRAFDILSVRNLEERDREMELICLERLN